MIKSMTGYGAAEGEIEGTRSCTVEIKTVNNRYLKTNLKLPEIAAFLEEDIEKLLRRHITRGTVNYVLRLKDVSSNTLFDIDEAALRSLIERLRRIGAAGGIDGIVELGSLLPLPGIIRPIMPNKAMIENIKQAVLDISQQAIEKLKEMRIAEGSFLESDLKCRCEEIEKELDKIRSRSANVIEGYSRRLKKRVDELLAEAKLKLDEQTLAREAAIMADRADISEEIARLDSHLLQFLATCQANDQAGRRLDFISQEMLREANTIASKAIDADIIRCVVDMKCQIDRIKEQIQNVE